MTKTFADYGIDTRGKSGTVKTTCPQCSASRANPKDPCLSVDTDKECWKCHHCGWAGGLPRRASLWETPTPKPYTKPAYRPSLSLPLTLTEYFAGRGITAGTLEAAQVTLTKMYFAQAGGEIPTIQFPYRRDGVVVNIKSRGLDHKVFRQEAGAEKILYGLDGLAEQTEAIIVEGEIDQLSCVQAGLTHCVSVPDGAPPPGSKSSDKKFEYLVNCEAQLAPLTKIILAVDNDPPGRALEEELARRLGPERCWRVQWPEGVKDANQCLTDHGAEILRACIASATPWPIAGIIHVIDLLDDLERLYERGEDRGALPGWPDLDPLYSVRPGELTIVTGIPGHGKSEFLDALLVNLARSEDWVFGLCSPENFPVSQHVAKLLEKVIRKPFRQGPTPRMDWRDIAEGAQWLHDHFVFFNPTEAQLTLEGILELTAQVVRRYGIRGMVLDPWNEIEHAVPPQKTEAGYIGEALTKLRRFARAHAIHLWIVAHPMKLMKQKGKNTYPVPTPYDISGSAHWRNKADNCLAVYRDVLDPLHRVEVHVQKIRFRATGKVGLAELTWNPVDGTYR